MDLYINLCNYLHMILKYAILSILTESEKSGYDLTKNFESSIGYYWSAKHQQIYKTLADMHKDEWVNVKTAKQASKPDKKLYSITVIGEQALRDWAILPTKSPARKNQLLIKLLLVRLVGPKPILEQLNVRLKEVYVLIGEYSKVEKEYFTPKPGPDTHIKNITSYLTLRHGMLSAHAELDWLHEAIETLENQHL